MITQERLKELLEYNEATGYFTWKASLCSRRREGDIVGKDNKAYLNYISITIDNNKYKLHRLVWLYVYGHMPNGQIDHINQIRKDNRLVNLREVNNIENSRNHTMNKNNISGVTGVHWDRGRNKWMAYIKVDYKRIHLGRFTSKEEAIAARAHAEQLYGFHENHGTPKAL